MRGRFVFFGPWGDPEGALQRYLERRDELHARPAGFAPPVMSEAPGAPAPRARVLDLEKVIAASPTPGPATQK